MVEVPGELEQQRVKKASSRSEFDYGLMIWGLIFDFPQVRKI